MSKELEALENIRYLVVFDERVVDEYGDEEPIKIFLDEELPEDYKIIEKSLKALDIIKERMRIEFHEYPNGLYQVVAFPKEQTWVGLGTELYCGNCKEEYELLKEGLLCQ